MRMPGPPAIVPEGMVGEPSRKPTGLPGALSVRALGAWQKTYGGLQLPSQVTDANFYYHDQLGAEGYWNVGASGSYSLSGNVDLYAAYVKGLSATNGHLINRALSFNPDGSFQGVANIHENVALSADGNSYSGSFSIDQYDTQLNLLAHIVGNITATRITVNTKPTDLF